MGLDWAVTGLSVGSKYLIADGRRIGWVISFVNQGLWVAVCVEKDLWGLVLLSVFNAALCVKGYYKFKKMESVINES